MAVLHRSGRRWPLGAPVPTDRRGGDETGPSLGPYPPPGTEVKGRVGRGGLHKHADMCIYLHYGYPGPGDEEPATARRPRAAPPTDDPALGVPGHRALGQPSTRQTGSPHDPDHPMTR